jgi:UDP-N-acetylmuramoyl-tripeptide--D-alanyl-D-alanine ligase
MKLTSQEITVALGSELKNKTAYNPNDLWTEWSTDSRQNTTRGLFFALVGENFDAHDYLQQAYDNGARAFVVSESIFKNSKSKLGLLEKKDAVIFEVNSTEIALQKISVKSASKLNTLKVAITGTSGKTSAKYFCHQILEGFVDHYFSPKSFNNHIGVPMTLLELNSSHKVGLIEIGMNHPGEIAQLVEMAKPNVTVVTMVGRGHLEGVGTIENVLNEKMSIYKEGHTHIINLDDSRIYLDYQKRYASNLNNPKMKILTLSTKDKTADIYFKMLNSSFDAFEIEGHISGVEGKALVPIAGDHHVYNIAIAAAVAITAGMSAKDIWSQINNLKPVWGRSEILKTKNDISIYFDAYNANPESMKAFLMQTKYLSEAPYFVLGEMLEMGDAAPKLHYELGQLVAQTPHKKVWFIGPSASHFKEGYGAVNPSNKLMISNTYEDSLALKYQSMLQPKDWVALKASRGIGLEKFLKNLI